MASRHHLDIERSCLRQLPERQFLARAGKGRSKRGGDVIAVFEKTSRLKKAIGPHRRVIINRVRFEQIGDGSLSFSICLDLDARNNFRVLPPLFPSLRVSSAREFSY